MPSSASSLIISVRLALDGRALVVPDLGVELVEPVAELGVPRAHLVDERGELLGGQARQLDRPRLRAQLPDEEQPDDQRHGEEADLGDPSGHHPSSESGAPQRSRVLPMKAGSVTSSRASLANSSP